LLIFTQKNLSAVNFYCTYNFKAKLDYGLYFPTNNINNRKDKPSML